MIDEKIETDIIKYQSIFALRRESNNVTVRNRHNKDTVDRARWEKKGLALEMELKWAVLILAALLGSCVLGIELLRRFNTCYYAAKLGKMWAELPPGDMGWPLLGSTLSFVQDMNSGGPENFLRTFKTRYGKMEMYKTHIFGRPSIIVCTPDLCRQVLTDESRFIPSFPSSIKILSGRKSLMQVTKAEHKRLRRITTTPISGHAALAMYIGHIENTVVTALEEWASMQRPIEFLAEIKTLTFRVIWNIFMGSSSLDSSMGAMEKLFYEVALGFASLPINLPGFSFRKSFKARKRLTEVLQSIINEKRLVKESKGESWEAKDTMDMLMEVKDEDGKGLDDETIIDLIFGKLFAGHETSAYTAMWAVLFLTEHPHTFKTAKEEQEEIIKRRPSTQNGINFAEFKQMRYLSQVIDETLRVGEITFVFFREAAVDVEISGKAIPKGWRVLPWLGEVHKDAKLYSSPQEFNPSRWDNFTPRAGTFVPFGLGNRYCPGSDLAKLEISIFLHYFVLNYTVERLTPECALTYLPFPHPKDKCLARVIKVA